MESIAQRIIPCIGYILYHYGVGILLMLYWWRIQPNNPPLSTKTRRRRVKRLYTEGSDSESTKSETVSVTSSESSSSTSSCSDDELQLERACPDATPAERVRFLTKHSNVTAATRALQHYLTWRRTYLQYYYPPTSTTGTDAQDWQAAAQCAWRVHHSSNSTSIPSDNVHLPQMIHAYVHNGSRIRDLQGHNLFVITPGRTDDRLAPIPVYALATAIYVDQQLPRDSHDLVTLLLDIRGGHGWRNLSLSQLRSHIAPTVRLLVHLFPQRLHQALVVPLPQTCAWMWRAVRQCLDVRTRDKMQVMAGAARIDAALPMEQLALYMRACDVAFMEEERKRTFVVAR
jgi:hypothetical protein